MAQLHPKMAARGQAVKEAYAHLSKTNQQWSQMSASERFRAVHAHIDNLKGGIAGRMTSLRTGGAFKAQ